MKKVKLYQQGDVLIFTAGEIPADVKPVKASERGFVLAEGEATGHAHTIDTIDLCELFQDNANNLWLEVKTEEGVTVRHQEHKHVTLPKGKYKIGIVREVDPFAEEIRKVQD